MDSSKLSRRIKVGYGLCTAAETIPGNLLAVYFVFFLTDIVGIRAYIAGVIFFIIVLWDALIDPIIGGLSDRHVTRNGRRFTWMKASVLPLAAAIFLMFSPFNINNKVLETLFYIFAAIFVCTAYSSFIIPYLALSAEITPSYSERNMLRFMAMIFYYPIFLVTTSGPMLIWEMAEEAGLSDREAWGISGAVFAILMLIICGIGLFMLRKAEKNSIRAAAENNTQNEAIDDNETTASIKTEANSKTEAKIKTEADSKTETQSKKENKNYFKIWKELLQLKSFRKIVLWIVIYMLGVSMINTVIVYFLTYNMAMSETEQAVFWVVFVAIIVCTLPITTKLCNKFGKRPVTLATMIPSIILGFVLFFTGINSHVVLYIYVAGYAISSSCFFTFFVAYAHDCVEIDELKSGERRDGSLSALASLAHQLGVALALPATGIYLELTGYNGMAETQTETAINGIHTMVTILPAALAVIAFAILWTYPVSKKKYSLLHSALERKKAGEEYSTEGFEDILV
ncbi:MAG: MFS transporter [Oscillospiraceae bacterium]|nr:MFS transporter [Oscillospiraceae bacterium]